MSRRPPVPPAAATREPVRLADAARLGLPRHELLSPRWQHVGRGVRAWHALDPMDPGLRIGAVLLGVPKYAALGGWASLWWQGVRTRDGLTGPAAGTAQPVLVHVGPTGHLRHRTGVVVDRSRLADADVLEVRGARVTAATRAVVDVMCRDGVEEGMVAGDAACAAGLTSPERLAAYVANHPGNRGVPRARRAAPLVSPWSRSVPESRFRYVWVVQAGLPAPLVNATVVDGDHGWFAGEVDLLDDEAGMVGEYDGAHHRELAAHTADNSREERLEALGLIVVRATSLDLWPGRRRLVHRLRARHADGLARDRSRDRWGIRRR